MQARKTNLPDFKRDYGEEKTDARGDGVAQRLGHGLEQHESEACHGQDDVDHPAQQHAR